VTLKKVTSGALDPSVHLTYQGVIFDEMQLKIQFMLVYFMVKENIPDVKYSKLLNVIHIILLMFFPSLPPFSPKLLKSFLVFLSMLADVGRGFVKNAYLTSQFYAIIADEYTSHVYR
jgi:hypothetical protein